LSLPLNVSPQLPIWFWHYYIPQLTPIKFWLAEGEEIDRALALLIEMDEFLRNINRHIHRIDILALQALAYKSLNNWPKALENLAQSVELAARGKLIRNYLNMGPQMRELLDQLYKQQDLDKRFDWPYIARILEAFATENSEDGQCPSPTSISIDPLTTREREVLQFLATDLSTREIAQEMDVTWSTIRTHIKNIYSKLGVHGRYEAVLHAEEHDLL
jgi:LuxR family maltose regulon positive regulatory protein